MYFKEECEMSSQLSGRVKVSLGVFLVGEDGS